jgi:hypothetical protein
MNDIAAATAETVVPTAIQPQRLIEYKYGIRTNVRLTPADVECYAFRNTLQSHDGGLGTYGHCRELAVLFKSPTQALIQFRLVFIAKADWHQPILKRAAGLPSPRFLHERTRPKKNQRRFNLV